MTDLPGSEGSRSQKKRILIVDDHPFFRKGLRQAFDGIEDVKVVGEACNGFEAVDLARRLKPDVILMDMQMAGLDGVQATRMILAEDPNARVIVLTAFARDDYVFDALRAGARGYLLKGVDEQTLADAVRAVVQGDVHLDGSVAGDVVKEFRRLSQVEQAALKNPARAANQTAPGAAAQTKHDLTPGEMEVLCLVARGEDNQGIARRLGLSEKTISNRMTTIYEKLQVATRIQAALVALRNGWVEL
jgi:two-component system, NarL family, response regulator LiaR